MDERQAISTRKTKIFISYARADGSVLAQELFSGLNLAGFEAFLDKYDIEKGEDWEERLRGLILSADTVIFIISPSSIHSERCNWEVERTLELGKRLIPVQWIAVPEAEVPLALKRLNYTFFDKGQSFVRPLAELVDALRKDIAWIRIHTRIGEQAARWKATVDSKKAADLLLRGSELLEAVDWRQRRKDDAPTITQLQLDFLQASDIVQRQARRRAQRAAVFVSCLGLLLTCVTVGWWQQKPLLDAYRWHWILQPTILTLDEEAKMSAKPGAQFAECVHGCPVMVVLPMGSFSMGSPKEIGEPREHPQHRVNLIHRVAVAKFELTFDEWEACAGFGDCPRVAAGEFGRGRQPIVHVSWLDANTYVRWLSKMTGKRYRLLSEAEWEYAARAGTSTHFSFGDNDAALGQYGWFSANSDERPHPVGSLKANPWGLADVHGNVAEWVEDCFHDSYVGAPVDGTAWGDSNCSRRVVRGGDFIHPARALRAASRDWVEFHDRLKDYIGIRIARDLINSDL
jgi:formylglycine-generating enzyme required for sulfatase activity